MKIGLSSDFGTPEHWRRLVDFAKAHGVSQLVHWSVGIGCYAGRPFLFPKYPGLLGEEERQAVLIIREKVRQAAAMCREAGVGFWFSFHAIMMPKTAAQWGAAGKGLFNAEGEPDMGNPRIYEIIKDQVDELMELAPNLAGLELWIEEGSEIVVTDFSHQSVPMPEYLDRIVGAVHEKCVQHKLELSVDLHTGGGHRLAVDSLLVAARKRPDILVSADNTIGDFHLCSPFNVHLYRASVTNPLLVHFDVHAEYWGRNFYPSVNLSQLAQHIEEARSLGAVYVNARIATVHDSWSPHANVLPGRRKLYPQLARVQDGEPIPKDLELCCFDTLGGFNAEFFCRRAVDPTASPRETVCEFLRGEFGTDLPELADVFMDVEGVAARVYYAGQGLSTAQSILPDMGLVWGWFAHGEVLTAKAGAAFAYPFAQGMPSYRLVPYHAGTMGPSYRAIGPVALIEEKRQAQADAEDLVVRARAAVAKLGSDAQRFILQKFEDFAFFARAAYVVLEAEVHYFYMCTNKTNPGFPDARRVNELIPVLADLADRWDKRQPHDEYHMSRRLRAWHKEIVKSLDERGLLAG